MKTNWIGSIARVVMGSWLLASALVLLAGCELLRTPLRSTTRAVSSPSLVVPSLPSATTATPSATTTPPSTRTPISTPTPTSGGDLGQYFTQWQGDPFTNPPQWMEEPPQDRQVELVHDEKDWYSTTLSLLDNQGNLLARFSPLEPDGAAPSQVLWSSSKDRAVVLFRGPSPAWSIFMLIDRDGNRLGDTIYSHNFPVWSPNIDLIAFEGSCAGENRLCIIEEGMVLTAGEPLSPRLCDNCGDLPQWSPNGSCAAVIVQIGEMAVPQDDLLAVVCPDGAVFHVKLWDYGIDDGHLRWLDGTHLLMRGKQQRQPDMVRYLLFDLETGTLREVTNSTDLTPTPLPPTPEQTRCPWPSLGEIDPATFVPCGLLKEEQSFQDYTVRIYTDGPVAGALEVLKGGTRIYAQIGFARLQVGRTNASIGVIPMGQDITGDGSPDLVIYDDLAGAYCCMWLDIFEIGQQFRHLGTIWAGDYEPEIEDLDGDGNWEFIIHDGSFRSYLETNRRSGEDVDPLLILHYDDGGYHLAQDLMRRPAPTEEELQQQAVEFQPLPWEYKQELRFWRTVLDLIYSGHADLVPSFLEQVFPDNNEKQMEIILALRENLPDDEYWPEIKELSTDWTWLEE